MSVYEIIMMTLKSLNNILNINIIEPILIDVQVSMFM